MDPDPDPRHCIGTTQWLFPPVAAWSDGEPAAVQVECIGKTPAAAGRLGRLRAKAFAPLFRRKEVRVIFRAKTVTATLATVRAWVGHKGFSTFIPVFQIRIRIGSGFNQVSGSGPVFGIRIRIQEGTKGPQK